MKKVQGILSIIVLLLLPVWLLLNIVLAVFSLRQPPEPGEFSAMHNASTELSALLTLLLSIVMLILYIFLRKGKFGAWLTILLLLFLQILVLAVSDLAELIFQISPGNALSVNHELIPVLLMVFLLFSRRNLLQVQA